MVVYKSAIKYLGVIIDVKLSFRKHLEYTYQKVASATTALESCKTCGEAHRT